MSHTRRTVLIALAFAAMHASMAAAAERMTYETNAFRAAQETGKPILVHVTTSWCAECQVQKPIVARLAGRPEFEDLIIFDVDFDTQKEAVRALNVRKQSTLLVFKGRAEIARVVGDTRFEVIEALMNKAL
jgi:thiol-disulfide isomerase/thioredoxin